MKHPQEVGFELQITDEPKTCGSVLLFVYLSVYLYTVCQFTFSTSPGVSRCCNRCLAAACLSKCIVGDCICFFVVKTTDQRLKRKPCTPACITCGQVRQTDGWAFSLLFSLSHPLLVPFPPSSSSSVAAVPLASIWLSSWERCCLCLRAHGKPLGARRSSR